MESSIRSLVPTIIPLAFYDIFPLKLAQLPHNGGNFSIFIIDLILLFALFFFGVYRLVHLISCQIPQYNKLPPLKRRAWRSHLVSQIHAVGVCYGALNVILNPTHYENVLFGRSDQAEFWFCYVLTLGLLIRQDSFFGIVILC
jgi:hypothetical protein